MSTISKLKERGYIDYLYVSKNDAGYYSIDNKGRALFPYKDQLDTSKIGFIKDISIKKDKKSYAFYTGRNTKLKRPSYNDLSEYCKMQSLILIPIMESCIDDEEFLLCKLFDPDTMDYLILNVAVDSDNEIGFFNIIPFQHDAVISSSISNYIYNIIEQVADDLDISDNILEYIQYSSSTADYNVCNNKVLVINDYSNIQTRYIFKIYGNLFKIEIDELLLESDSNHDKELTKIFDHFIDNNPITFSNKGSYIKDEKYSNYIKINYNNKYEIYIPKLEDAYIEFGLDFVKDLFRFCNEKNK